MARPIVLLALVDASLRATVSQYLDLEGFQCESADSGTAALALAARLPLAAALLDNDLTDPDALTVARALRADPATAACALLLLAGDDMEAAAAINAGAAVVIDQPFHVAAVAARLRELVPGVPPPER